MDFTNEIEALTGQLEAAKHELTTLEQAWAENTTHTSEIRASLTRLAGVLDGKLEPTKPKRRTRKKAGAVAVNAETGRPKRGARTEQVHGICVQLGEGGKTFRTRDVNDQVSQLEGEASMSLKSTVSTILVKLARKGIITKAGRGSWTLA